MFFLRVKIIGLIKKSIFHKIIILNKNVLENY